MAEALKDYALTTPDRTKDYLQISGDADDDLITRLINGITEYVERFTARHFQKTEYSAANYSDELHSVGMGEVSMNLLNYPVISTAEFKLEHRDSNLNEDDWEEVDQERYFVDYNSGIIYTANGTTFAEGIKNYRVTYTAGYDFDNEETFLSDTAAGEVEIAVWKLVGACFQRRASAGVQQESIGDYSVTYTSASLEDEEIHDILVKFKNFDIGLGGRTPRNF